MRNNTEPTIATGYERLAIELGLYIKFYTPKGWRSKISDYAFTPSFLAEDAEMLMIGHKIGELEEVIEFLSKNSSSESMKEDYIHEAIKNFFDRKLYVFSIGEQ
jgi:hypothetical protein